jgi:SHS2 domain-containing protein
MMPYEILEHTADEKFRATGETLDEAFSSVVEAFSEIARGEGGMYHHDLEVEAENLEALLFDFLDRMILLQDTEQVVIAGVDEIEAESIENGYWVECVVLVDKITRGMSPMDIKAPTYNEMKADYEDGEWVLEAVLDI